MQSSLFFLYWSTVTFLFKIRDRNFLCKMQTSPSTTLISPINATLKRNPAEKAVTGPHTLHRNYKPYWIHVECSYMVSNCEYPLLGEHLSLQHSRLELDGYPLLLYNYFYSPQTWWKRNFYGTHLWLALFLFGKARQPLVICNQWFFVDRQHKTHQEYRNI